MSELAELHDELRAVARSLLGRSASTGLDWRAVTDAGWPGLEVPAACGGAEATFAETAVILEEVGRAAAPGPFLGTAVLAAAALPDAPVGGRRDQLLSALANGQRLAVVVGPDPDAATAAPAFRIEHEGGARLLHGRAGLVPDAPGADRLLVLATDPGGRAVLVDLDPARLHIEEELVLDETRRFGNVVAEGVAVADDDIVVLGGEPLVVAQRLLDRAAVAIACDSIGLAATMLDRTVEYAGARHQFGRPIGSFQAVKHACADMLVSLTVARTLVADAVGAVAQAAPGGGVQVARAKSFATAAAVDVVGSALQLHGGIGYTWESGVHVYLKRATLNRSLFGSPSAHRRRIAAHLTSDRDAPHASAGG